ncbi:hypothetical protein SEA_SATIS_144 [Streptomyces phage Satis]|nr:hypothetical protein SEA_SATIS_144 [Streptomyces phage Satis]QBZ72040.1 hypothetical protein SEA_KRADAL_144 [Streptomyces phage Kradal]QPL14460.1 hypothetical protein SEA_EHYELIMAYOE_145 [Streptomyces phage EhyElimayoE]
MSSYYAVPVRRENRTLTFNPFDGHCALAATPHDAYLQLGLPKAGEMFAVWPLNTDVDLEKAGEICSVVAPLRIFIVLDETGVMFPLGIDPMLDAVMEVPDARRD